MQYTKNFNTKKKNQVQMIKLGFETYFRSWIKAKTNLVVLTSAVDIFNVLYQILDILLTYKPNVVYFRPTSFFNINTHEIDSRMLFGV